MWKIWKVSDGIINFLGGFLSGYLAGHRFDDIRRYPKLPSRGSAQSVIRIGRKDGDDAIGNVVPISSDKKTIDHSPHEVS